MTVVANDGTDQTANVIEAANNGIDLPPGVINCMSPILLRANSASTPGFRLRGAPGYRTTLVANFNGDATHTGLIQIDVGVPRQFSMGTVIEDLMLQPAPGTTGLNAISLTAAWETTINRVRVFGGKSFKSGIVTPWRPDLSPGLSDLYQCWSLKISQCFIRDCTSHGIDLGAGQSPGGLHLSYSQSILNGGLGLRLTTGQCEIINNIFSYNGVGGIEVDTIEGPAQMGFISMNEIQDNWGYGINIVRSRNLRIERNRFLAQTYSSSDWKTAVPQAGGPFMTQFVHVNMGGGECWNLVCERNQHKTANGSTLTNATCYGYDAGGGVLSNSFPSQFIKNEFGIWPPDGITQNSTGFAKYVNIVAPSGLVTDP